MARRTQKIMLAEAIVEKLNAGDKKETVLHGLLRLSKEEVAVLASVVGAEVPVKTDEQK